MKPVKQWIFPTLLFFLLSLTENVTGPIWSGCNPPYLFCFTVICALFYHEKAAAVYGIFAGLTCDVFSSDLFGYRAVIYAVLGYLIAFLTATVISRNVISGTLLGVVGCFVSELALWGAICLRTPTPFSAAFRYVFLPRCLMALPVLLLLYWLFTRRERRDGTPRRRW